MSSAADCDCRTPACPAEQKHDVLDLARSVVDAFAPGEHWPLNEHEQHALASAYLAVVDSDPIATVPVRPDHLYAMVVTTVRYSLDRNTCAVDEACEIVKAYWSRLRVEQRAVVKRDVERHARDCCPPDCAGEKSGCKVLRPEWPALLTWMGEQS